MMSHLMTKIGQLFRTYYQTNGHTKSISEDYLHLDSKLESTYGEVDFARIGILYLAQVTPYLNIA